MTEELIGLFDTHAHPTDERFNEDREQVLARMREAGMLCMCVGADMASSAQSVALANENENIYAAVGVHPHDAKDFTEADIPQLTRWLTQEKKVKALGEIGLDYYYDLSPREIQKTVFERQLDLAYELKKPVILHIRDAHGDTIEILRAHRDRLPHCVVHCCKKRAAGSPDDRNGQPVSGTGTRSGAPQRTAERGAYLPPDCSASADGCAAALRYYAGKRQTLLRNRLKIAKQPQQTENHPCCGCFF